MSTQAPTLEQRSTIGEREQAARGAGCSNGARFYVRGIVNLCDALLAAALFEKDSDSRGVRKDVATDGLGDGTEHRRCPRISSHLVGDENGDVVDAGYLGQRG